jgi:hypothetical protein
MNWVKCLAVDATKIYFTDISKVYALAKWKAHRSPLNIHSDGIPNSGNDAPIRKESRNSRR